MGKEGKGVGGKDCHIEYRYMTYVQLVHLVMWFRLSKKYVKAIEMFVTFPFSLARRTQPVYVLFCNLFRTLLVKKKTWRCWKGEEIQLSKLGTGKKLAAAESENEHLMLVSPLK